VIEHRNDTTTPAEEVMKRLPRILCWIVEPLLYLAGCLDHRTASSLVTEVMAAWSRDRGWSRFSLGVRALADGEHSEILWEAPSDQAEGLMR
jgi:hypothetical protein